MIECYVMVGAWMLCYVFFFFFFFFFFLLISILSLGTMYFFED